MVMAMAATMAAAMAKAMAKAMAMEPLGQGRLCWTSNRWRLCRPRGICSNKLTSKGRHRITFAAVGAATKG